MRIFKVSKWEILKIAKWEIFEITGFQVETGLF